MCQRSPVNTGPVLQLKIHTANVSIPNGGFMVACRLYAEPCAVTYIYHLPFLSIHNCVGVHAAQQFSLICGHLRGVMVVKKKT